MGGDPAAFLCGLLRGQPNCRAQDRRSGKHSDCGALYACSIGTDRRACGLGAKSTGRYRTRIFASALCLSHARYRRCDLADWHRCDRDDRLPSQFPRLSGGPGKSHGAVRLFLSSHRRGVGLRALGRGAAMEHAGGDDTHRRQRRVHWLPRDRDRPTRQSGAYRSHRTIRHRQPPYMSTRADISIAPEAGRGRGMALVFMAGVLWSTVGLGIRMIEDGTASQILLTRSVGLCVLLYGVSRLRTGRDPFGLARATGWSGLLGGLSLVGAYGGGIYAIQTTSVANAMLLFASAPFMAAVLGQIFLAERVRPHTWIAIGVAMLGIALMVRDQTAAASLTGNLAALGAAVGFAVFTVIIRKGRMGDMLPLVFISGLAGIVLMVAVCLALGLPLVMGARDTGIALTMGVFQVGAGLVLYTIGSKSVPAAELTLLSLAEVVLGPVWVWLALGEQVSRNTLMGGAVLLAAIAGNAMLGARRKRPPPHV